MRRLHTFPTHCRHLEHGVEAKCDKGIDIRAHIGGSEFGWARRMPCMGGQMSTPEHPMVHCGQYERPSDEEVMRDNAILDQQMAFLNDNMCPLCGVRLTQRGNVSTCGNGCDVSVRICGSGDLAP